MKYLKKDSAHTNTWRNAFNNAIIDGRTLKDVYVNPSFYKRNAWLGIVRSSRAVEGSYPVILSYNTYSFTAGFHFPDPETGVLKVAIFTSQHEYCFEW